MRSLMLMMAFPALLCAQEFEFQFQPEAFPVEINGWELFSPWAGGFSESKMAAADLDADGDLDLFIGVFLGTIYHFNNHGTSSSPNFELETSAFASIDVDSRANPCFRDMDADGDLDLFFSDGYPHVIFYKNIGTPTEPNLLFEDTVLVSGPPWCRGPELVDINDDGDYDLFGGSWGQISYFANIGTPQTFNFQMVTGAFEGIDVGDKASPEFVDIDADGDYDLFIGDEIGRIWYYLNDGDSVNYHFTYMTDFFDSIDVGDYSSPEFADIDGDGDYDLFVGREPAGYFGILGDVYFYRNEGTPTMAQFELVTTNYLTADVGWISINPQVVDLNGDRAPELVVGATNILTYFENVGDSLNPGFSLMEEQFQGIYLPVIKPFFVDIDADGDLDLFAGEGVIPGPPTIALYLNRGTPQNPELVLYDPAFISNPDFDVNTNPGLVDIDADGDFDLLVNDDATGRFYFYRNDGIPQSPTFTLVDSQWQGIEDPGGWRGFCFGDLDGDGDQDLLMAQHTAYQHDANLRYYENTGSPQNANMTLVTTAFLQDSVSMACPYLIDIDLDGDLDLFCGESSGGFKLFRNVTGEPPAVPPLVKHPQAGFHLSIGPNPANPVTFITFSLPYPQEATLAVYNLLGAKVTTLTSGLHPPGEQSFLWDASRKASGVYVVRLEAVGEVRAGKILVIK